MLDGSLLVPSSSKLLYSHITHTKCDPGYTILECHQVHVKFSIFLHLDQAWLFHRVVDTMVNLWPASFNYVVLKWWEHHTSMPLLVMLMWFACGVVCLHSDINEPMHLAQTSTTFILCHCQLTPSQTNHILPVVVYAIQTEKMGRISYKIYICYHLNKCSYISTVFLTGILAKPTILPE